MNRHFYILVCLILAACKVQDKVLIQQDPLYIKEFHSGVRNMLNNQHELAILDFKACLQRAPKDAAVHYALFQTYLKLGRFDEAVYHTEQAATLEPKNFHYKRELAFMYQQLGKTQQAANVFESLILDQPKTLEFYSAALICYEQLNKPAKSLSLVQKMELELGENPSTILEKFRLLQQMGKIKESIELMETARISYPSEPSILANLVDFYFRTQNYSAGFNILEELVTADPKNGVAQLMYGEMLYRSGKIENAITHISEGILRDGPSIDQKMNVLIMLVNDDQQKFLDSRIEALVQYMTQAYPNEAKAHSIAGDYYYVQGEHKTAIKNYRQTLKLDPNLYPVWEQTLILEYQQGLWSQLLEDANNCAELFPSYALPFYCEGLASNHFGNYKNALEVLQIAKSLVIKDEVLLAEVNAQLGVSNFGLGQNQVAMGNFEDAIKSQPTNLTLKLNFLHELCKYQLDPEAHLMLQEIVKEHPANASCKQQLAFSFFMQGFFLDALDWQLKIKDPEFILTATFNEQLGDIYFHLGRQADAVRSWQTALNFGEGSAVLQQKISNKKYVQAP